MITTHLVLQKAVLSQALAIKKKPQGCFKPQLCFIPERSLFLACSPYLLHAAPGSAPTSQTQKLTALWNNTLKQRNNDLNVAEASLSC